MNPIACKAQKVDRRRLVQLAMRSAALGALGATGTYLALRNGPGERCPRRWPCAECGWRAGCAWADVPGGQERLGG